MATQTEVAAHLGVTQQLVSQLVAEGVFEKTSRGHLDLDGCRLAYVSRLRETAAGRAGSGSLDLTDERARLAKEQADSQEMKNAMLRREMIPSTEVTASMQSMIAHCRARLLSIPSKAAPAAFSAETIAEAREALEEYVNDALAELTETRAVSIPEDPDGGGDGVVGEPGDEGLGTAAKADRKRVGRPKLACPHA